MYTEDRSENHIRNGHMRQDNGSNHEKSFAELLLEYEPEPLHRGQFVNGEVIQIDHNVILADVDAKRTAVIPPQDLAEVEDDVLDQLSVGDQVVLYVLHTPKGNEDLLVSLNKGLEQQDWLRAKDYLDNEEPLELEIVGYNKGGLLADFGYLKGFVPASHVPQLQGMRDRRTLLSRKTELVGEEMLLNVIEVDRQRQRLILSAKKGQHAWRRQKLQELKLKEGATITGRINNLVEFGVFVDLDGIEGLIHISEIAWQKVEDTREHFSIGDEVEVLIRSVDIDRERISLSRKALLPSPWESYAKKHFPGDLVEGVVTSVTGFGAFVRVAEGIEGLVHTSEMYGTQDFVPQDLISPGDKVLVRILDIKPEEQRLSLSQRRVTQSEEIVWMQRPAQYEIA